MNSNFENLSDIFASVKETLIEHSGYSPDEFDREFDEYKRLADRHFTDDEYYWILVYIVFYSGFKAKTVTERLPILKRYFPDYKTVMTYGKDKIVKMLNDACEK